MAQHRETGANEITLAEETESSPPGGEIAIPNTETQVGLTNSATSQGVTSEVVISGGDFKNAALGPQTHKTSYQGYIRISDDIVMDGSSPLQGGCNVYKGYQEHVSGDGNPNRLPVAIKRIIPSTEKHKNEVGHLVTLAAHSNVVRIIRSKEHKTPHANVLYIVMELCSPQNLQGYIDKNREDGTPFNFKKTMDFTKQLLNGMKHIHDNGVVHRDVKPENVLLSLDKTQLKYTDFGLGKELRQGRTSTRVTIQGSSNEPLAQSNTEEGAVALSGRTYFAPEEQASRLRQEHKYGDAIAILEGLEPNERQQTILAECYFHVGRYAEASECMERLKVIISASIDHPKPDDAIKKIETYIDNLLFIQALFLLPSAAEICKKDSAPKDALWGFVLCVWRGASIVDSMYKEGGRMQSISKTVAIQTLHQIYATLQSYTGVDDDTKTDIGSSYLSLENYEEAMKFMQQGVDRMKSHFELNASKYSVLERLLNNLGVVFAKLGRYQEAEKYFFESLQACQNAGDYPSEKEKQESITQGREVLRRVKLLKKEAPDT